MAFRRLQNGRKTERPPWDPGYWISMDEPLNVRGEDDPDVHALWSEALWGLGLIGTVLAIVAVIAAFGT
jgi:hypothetical protein